MARYFFHFWDGDSFIYDTEGSDLTDANEAYLEGFETAQHLAIELIRDRRPVGRARLDIIDDRGAKLFEVTFAEAIGGRVGPHEALACHARARSVTDELAHQINATRDALKDMASLIKRV